LLALTAGGGMVLKLIFGVVLGQVALGMIFGLLFGAAVAARRRRSTNAPSI